MKTSNICHKLARVPIPILPELPLFIHTLNISKQHYNSEMRQNSNKSYLKVFWYPVCMRMCRSNCLLVANFSSHPGSVHASLYGASCIRFTCVFRLYTVVNFLPQPSYSHYSKHRDKWCKYPNVIVIYYWSGLASLRQDVFHQVVLRVLQTAGVHMSPASGCG